MYKLRFLNLLFKSLLVIFIFFIGIYAVVNGLLNTEYGKKRLFASIQYEIHKVLPNFTIIYKDFDIVFPFTFKLKSFYLLDNKEKILEIENLNIKINLFKILLRSLDVSHIKASNIIYSKTLTIKETKTSNLFNNIKISNIEIENLNIKEADISLYIKGDYERKISDKKNKIDMKISTKLLKFNDFDKIKDDPIDIELKAILNNKEIDITNLNIKFAGSINSGKLKYNSEIIEGILLSNKDEQQAETKFKYNVKEDSLNLFTNLEGKFLNGSFQGNLIDIKTKPKGEIIFDREDQIIKGKIEVFFDKFYKFNINNLALAGNNINGNLILSPRNNIVTGNLNFQIGDTSFLESFLDKNLKFASNINAKFYGLNDKQSVGISGKVSNIIYEDNKNCKEIDLDMILEDIWHLRLFKANYSLHQFTAGDFIIENQATKIEGSMDSFNFNSTIYGDYIGKFFLKTEGEYKNENEKQTITIKELKGNSNEINIEKTSPINITLENDDIILKETKIKVGEGDVLCTINSGAFIKFNNIPFQLLGLGYLKKANISGEINLTGKMDDPELYSLIKFKDKSLEGTLESKIEKQIFSSHADFKGQGIKHFKLDLRNPITFSLKPYKFYSDLSKADLSTNIEIDASTYTNIFLNPDHYIKGYISGNFSLKNGKPNGHLSLSEGEYQYLPWKLHISHINSKITSLANNKIDISLNSRSTEGECFAKGNMDYSNFLLNLDVNFNSFSLFKKLKSRIDGKLLLKGKLSELLLSGDLDLKELEIPIPDHINTRVPHLNILKEKAHTQEFFNIFSNLKTDINIIAKNRILVYGLGIDAELGGKLHITGLLTQPYIFGELKFIHGKYEEFGRNFKLTDGWLKFLGLIPPSPFLYLVGTTKISGQEINATLSGAILTPRIKVSAPGLKDEEVLSLLLFNKTLQNISYIQSLQLLNSLRKLVHTGQEKYNLDFMDKIRRSIKLDQLTINQSEENEGYKIGIGKYLSDKIYIEYEREIEDHSNKARIEYEFKRNFSLEGVVDHDGSKKAGINWKYNYK